MPWVPLDTHYLRDPKLQAAGEMTPHAVAAFPALLAMARDRANGGVLEVTYRDLAHELFISKRDAEKAIRALLRVGLFSPIDIKGAYVVMRYDPWKSRRKIPLRVRQQVIERYESICGLCEKPVDPDEPLHLDHIVPWSKGGDDSPANLQVAHASCNLAKGARA